MFTISSILDSRIPAVVLAVILIFGRRNHIQEESKNMFFYYFIADKIQDCFEVGILVSNMAIMGTSFLRYCLTEKQTTKKNEVKQTTANSLPFGLNQRRILIISPNDIFPNPKWMLRVSNPSIVSTRDDTLACCPTKGMKA